MGKNLVGVIFILLGLAFLLFPSMFFFLERFGSVSAIRWILIAVGVFIIGFIPSRNKSRP